jgi:hypothetical protein
MTNPIIQIGDEARPMNDDELAQHKLDVQAKQAKVQADAERAALKTATIAKLGLTADEVAALLS